MTEKPLLFIFIMNTVLFCSAQNGADLSTTTLVINDPITTTSYAPTTIQDVTTNVPVSLATSSVPVITTTSQPVPTITSLVEIDTENSTVEQNREILNDMDKLINILREVTPVQFSAITSSVVILMSLVSICINFVFLLIFKVNRRLRKSLLSTFYADLRRSFTSNDAMPLHRIL